MITSRAKSDSTEREAKVPDRRYIHARALYSCAFHDAALLGRCGNEGANGVEIEPGRRLHQFLECQWVSGGHDYRDFFDAVLDQSCC